MPYSRHQSQPWRKRAKDTPLSAHQEAMLAAITRQASDPSAYQPWAARAGTLLATLLESAGADHVICMDLHAPQMQGFFHLPLDNLPSLPLITKLIREQIPDWQQAVVVSPDAGGAKRASQLAQALGLELALIHGDQLVGLINDRNALLIDDMADTSDTLTAAANLLAERGARGIYAVITHGIFSGAALERIAESELDRVLVSNTLPQGEHASACAKLRPFDASPMFAEAIRRMHNGESLSVIYRPDAFY